SHRSIPSNQTSTRYYGAGTAEIIYIQIRKFCSYLAWYLNIARPNNMPSPLTRVPRASFTSKKLLRVCQWTFDIFLLYPISSSLNMQTKDCLLSRQHCYITNRDSCKQGLITLS